MLVVVVLVVVVVVVVVEVLSGILNCFFAANLSLCTKSVSVKSNLPKSVICRPTLYKEPILVGKPGEKNNICRT